MKYFAHIFKQYTNGTADKLSTYSYDSLDEAVAEVHTQYGQNVGDEAIAHIMCTIINSQGGQYAQHTLVWSAETEENTPTE